MKVTFEATLDDFVDVMVRSNPRTQEWYARLILSVIANAVLGVIVSQYLWNNWTLSSIMGLVLATYIPAANYNIVERRARNLYRNTYRIHGPVQVDVEVTERGLSIKQFGMTTIYDWNTVRLQEETDDAIYFRAAFGNLCAVRKRAFASEAEKNEFIELANRYWSEAAGF
jgi:hypothetical protein